MREVIEQLSAAGKLPGTDQIIGVPSAELDAWELRLGMRLPADYRAFMEAAGATSNAPLFKGDAFFWPDCVGIREDARDELPPDVYATIPRDAHFIFEHDGYIFGWLETHDLAEAAYVVQPMADGVHESRRIADSFRQLLLGDLRR